MEGISNLKYTTDKNGNGIIKFKYNGKEKVVYFTGKEINAQNLAQYYEALEKVVAGVNSAFGTKYTTDDVKIDKEGGAYIEVEYKGIKFNQYIYGKDGKVNDTTGLKTIAKNIEKLQNVDGLSNLEYTTDSNGYGIFKFKYNGKSTIIYFDGTEINTDNLVKYYETVEKVLRAVNEAFGTKYTIEDIKQDKTGGVYIEVEYKGVTFKQYGVKSNSKEYRKLTKVGRDK